MAYKTFPENCEGCQHETPTGACSALMDEAFRTKKNWWKNQYRIAYTKRRKDCPFDGKEVPNE